MEVDVDLRAVENLDSFSRCDPSAPFLNHQAQRRSQVPVCPPDFEIKIEEPLEKEMPVVVTRSDKGDLGAEPLPVSMAQGNRPVNTGIVCQWQIMKIYLPQSF